MMTFNLSGIRAAIAKKCIGGAAVGMAAMIGFSPLTAYAYSDEQECICETKCTEDSINEECEVCVYDWKCCEGEEKKEDEKEENWGPLTPDGNMNLVDDYGSIEAGGKQFITITSKSGNYFYIIIDRDDNGQETVHFLNLVDEADLLALMDDEAVEKYMESTGIGATEEEPITPTVTEQPVEEETPDVTEPEVTEKKSANVTGIMAVILVLAIGGIGGFLYFKTNKSKPAKPTSFDPDADYNDDDEPDYLDSLEADEDFEIVDINEDEDSEDEE